MKDLRIRNFAEGDRAAVIDVWKRCKLLVPQNDPSRDIDLKIGFQPDLFFVAESEGKIVGTVMAGWEGHRGWINYMAVKPEYQRNGIGKLLLDFATERLKELGCPKINLNVRKSNTAVMDFYRRCGFNEDEVVGMGKRL